MRRHRSRERKGREGATWMIDEQQKTETRRTNHYFALTRFQQFKPNRRKPLRVTQPTSASHREGWGGVSRGGGG